MDTNFEAMNEVQKHQAKSRISFALRHPVGPKSKVTIRKLRKTTSRRPCIDIHNPSKKWIGPHKFTGIDYETAVTTWKDFQIHARQAMDTIHHCRGITNARPSIKRRGT